MKHLKFSLTILFLCMASLVCHAVTIKVGGSTTLTGPTPGSSRGALYTWSPTYSSYVSMMPSSSGSTCKVTGEKAGSVTISCTVKWQTYDSTTGTYVYASSNKKTQTYSVTVQAADTTTPTSISLNYTSVSLNVGSTKQLSATVSPSGASQSVSWSVVSGSSYASVSSSGLVTAKLAGTATVRATSTANSSIYKDCTVTVTQSTSPTSISLNYTSISLSEGDTRQLTASVSPSGASQSVTWSVVSGSGVASVSSSGLVTALTTGTATIRATSSANSSVYANCNVTVTAATLNPGTWSGNTLTIGGNATSSTNMAPYNNYWTYSTSQMLYSPAEIGKSGTINSIAFKVASASSFTPTALKVYLGHKSSIFSNTSDYVASSSLTLVYDGTPTLGASTGWETLTFNKGTFNYNGTDNLVVVVAMKSSNYNTSLKYYYYTGSGYVLSRGSDSVTGYGDITNTSAYSTSTERPSIRLGFGQSQSGTTNIEINATNFPDANFRSYLLSQSYGSDGMLTQDEINGVTSFYISARQISSLKGIEHFTALTDLWCPSNQLTTLDVSKNTTLRYLYCYNNQLTTLDVSKNTALKDLHCYNNQLATLDVSKNTALTKLDCSHNQLTTLDVSGNTALTELRCAENQLATLDVSKNTALTNLDCSHNQLTTLDVSKNTALRYLLYCYNNRLTTLDVSKNTVLEDLSCDNNQLTTLDVSGNTALTYLSCSSNQLTTLDVSKNTALINLSCYKNNINGVNMDNLIAGLPQCNTNTSYTFHVIYPSDSNEGNVCTKAQVAAVKAKGWTPYYIDGSNYYEYEGSEDDGIAIDATNFPDANFRSYLLSQSYGSDGILTQDEINGVTSFYISARQISSLKGIEHFTALTGLSCSSNRLTTLDVSKNTALTELSCAENQLATLDVSKNTALTSLRCYSNQLATLDVSKNTALTNLDCSHNQLATLDVSKNTALTNLDCSHNQLTTLDVSKNTALTELECSHNQLTTLDVSKNTALTDLSCYNNQLATLDVSKNTALKYLDCFNNQLTTLDVSKNTALKYLYCYNNRLTTLDVSKNTVLEDLSCYNNQLTTLDVSGNTALTYLSCYSNQLTTLDVSKNTALTHLSCYKNNINGVNMDNLIAGLLQNNINSYKFRVIYPSASDEGNVCTKAQVAAVKAKGWTPYYYDGSNYYEYEGSEDDVESLESISLPESIQLSVGETQTLTPVFTPASAAMGVTWSSEDESIATVNELEGIVTAVSPGTTTICVVADDAEHMASCQVTVTEKVLHDGDTFAATTVEGVEMTYTVISAADKTCQTREIASGAQGTITIPEEVLGFRVISIGDSAFEGCTGLTSVTIPVSVISIGESAFEGCSSLATITVPNSVTSIGRDAFDDTSWYDNQPNGLIYAGKVLYKYKGTMPEGTQITIEEGTLGIAGEAFRECSGLISIIMPNSVTNIGERAFKKCTGLTSITIGSGVIRIGYEAFARCSNLASIVIPESVIYMENYTFDDTPWFENQPDGLVYAGKVLYDYKGRMPEGTHIDIMEGTLAIAGFAFEKCGNLTSVTIPNSVLVIGNNVFSDGANNITSVTIGSGVKDIEEEAFRNCRSLTTVTIPKNVESIGENAFSLCSGLTSITSEIKVPFAINKNVFQYYDDNSNTYKPLNATLYVPYGTKVLYEAASGWNQFTNIVEMEDTNEAIEVDGLYYEIVNSNVINAKIGQETLPSDTDVAMVVEAANGHEYGDDIVIPDSITFDGNTYDVVAIAECAFAEYKETELTSVVIPNSVVLIDDEAFVESSTLERVEIPNSVRYIGDDAFADCESLSEIVSYIQEPFAIGTKVFRNIANDATLYVPFGTKALYEATTGWNTIANIVEMEEPNEAIEVDGLYYEIANSDEINVAIGEEVLQSNVDVAVVVEAPQGHKYHGDIVIPASITYENNTYAVAAIGECAFAEYKEIELTSVVIPNSVVYIAEEAFVESSTLERVEIPNSVRYIGDDAFADCESLSEIVSYIQEPFAIGTKVFRNIANDATLYVPFGTKTLYEAAVGWNRITKIVEMEPDIEPFTDIAQMDNVLYVENAEGIADGRMTFYVKMKNSVTAEGFFFRLYLPEGFSYMENFDGKLDVSLYTDENRFNKSNIEFNDPYIDDDGSLVVNAQGKNGYTISGNDGKVVRIRVMVPEDMPVGSYPLLIKNGAISDNLGTMWPRGTKPDVKCSLAVVAKVRGDANGDAVQKNVPTKDNDDVNAGDYVTITHYILGLPYDTLDMTAGDANGDGVVNGADLTAITILKKKEKVATSAPRMAKKVDEREAE